MSGLKNYLNQKPIFYQKMSYFEFYSLYHSLNFDLSGVKTIQILGTNGKGTTGRYLANLLAACGYDVFHFTSPHLLSLNERFYYAGHDKTLYEKTEQNTPNPYFLCSNFSNEVLDFYHEKLEQILKSYSQTLSYFEYVTLLFMYIVSSLKTQKTFIVLEAGLGGEYDATSVVRRYMCVYTRIRHDHVSVLGEKLEDIITTKLKAMSSKNIILHHPLVQKKAKFIAKLKGYKVKFVKTKKQFLDQNFLLASRAFDEIMSEVDIAFKTSFKHTKFISSHKMGNDFFAKHTKFAPNQQKLHKINKFYPNPTRHLLQILQNLPARCSFINGVLLDCGHNLDCAKNHAKMIKKHFKKKPSLVCNFFKDKDVRGILSYLKQYIKDIYILEYESPRELENVAKLCDELGIFYTKIDQNELKSLKNISVFGSFLVVEHFVKSYYKT